jgi:hypothetical protein
MSSSKHTSVQAARRACCFLTPLKNGISHLDLIDECVQKAICRLLTCGLHSVPIFGMMGVKAFVTTRSAS